MQIMQSSSTSTVDSSPICRAAITTDLAHITVDKRYEQRKDRFGKGAEEGERLPRVVNTSMNEEAGPVRSATSLESASEVKPPGHTAPSKYGVIFLFTFMQFLFLFSQAEVQSF